MVKVSSVAMPFPVLELTTVGISCSEDVAALTFRVFMTPLAFVLVSVIHGQFSFSLFHSLLECPIVDKGVTFEVALA